ncbi:MAG: hypothetical protein RLZZ317_833 [Actinomycetota bacterium]
MGGEVSKEEKRHRSLLEEISIRGIGVIDNATVQFSPGLNVITGETGAGKTMVLTALNLILGGKSDPDLIRSDHERLHAVGRFEVNDPRNPALLELLDEHDVDIDSEGLLLSRSVTRDGKSKAQLSGMTSTAGVLSAIGGHLVEVHGQHGNLQLSKASRQRELLDAFAGDEVASALGLFRKAFKNYNELVIRVKELRKSLGDRDREIASLKATLNEFEKLKPRRDEFLELVALIERLESVEDLRVAATGALQALDDEQSGAMNSLHAVRRFLSTIKGKDAQLDEISERFGEAFYTLNDVNSDLARYLDGLSADPTALDNAQSRRAALISFAKKQGLSGDNDGINEALDIALNARARIEDLTGGDEKLAELESQLTVESSKVIKEGKNLSFARTKAAAELDKRITAELAALAMPHGKFHTSVTQGSIDDLQAYTNDGVDNVSMLFTSHGGDLLPIAKAASGGELSRLMLAIEVVIASRFPVGTYIFDEVDAGIGGKAALEVGKRLRELAHERQVIVVTHLPQVAIWADRHIVVTKDQSGKVTTSSLTTVEANEREKEIARMLSGVEESEHAQEHARELLDLRKREVR